MPQERGTPDAGAAVLNLRREEPMADGGDGSPAIDALKQRMVQKLRDPLGIAAGMAESIPDLTDDLRRLCEGSSALDEIAAVLDELERAADLITSNVTRALSLVERGSLQGSERRQTGSDE